MASYVRITNYIETCMTTVDELSSPTSRQILCSIRGNIRIWIVLLVECPAMTTFLF